MQVYTLKEQRRRKCLFGVADKEIKTNSSTQKMLRKLMWNFIVVHTLWDDGGWIWDKHFEGLNSFHELQYERIQEAEKTIEKDSYERWIDYLNDDEPSQGNVGDDAITVPSQGELKQPTFIIPGIVEKNSLILEQPSIESPNPLKSNPSTLSHHPLMKKHPLRGSYPQMTKSLKLL